MFHGWHYKSLVCLVAIYSEQRNAEKVVAMSLKALESLGFILHNGQLPASIVQSFRVERWGIMVDDVISIWAWLWNAYAALAPHFLPQAAACWELTYKICTWEDVAFWKNIG